MTRSTRPPANEPKTIARRLPWGAFAVMGLIIVSVAIWRSPVYSFHPTCTYTVNARVSADVEIDGQALSSTVVYQNSRSRRWFAMINSAGCNPLYGTALTFRTANDSVLIIPSRICYDGEMGFAKSGRIDVLSACTGKQAHQDSAFLVDSASRPTTWRSVVNGVDFRITSMTAVSTWANPADDIAGVAPNLLKSDFKYGRSNQWSRSPEKLISFQRRYSERRHKPDQAYEFTLKKSESFKVE